MGNLYKHPKFGFVYGEAMVLPFGRCAWPSLVKPKDPPPPKEGEQPGQPRYEITYLLDKSDPKVQGWMAAIAKMGAEMLKLFNEGRKAKLSIEEYAKDGNSFDLEKYPYYKDQLVLVARNAKVPTFVDKKKKELSAEAIQGGMIVGGVVTPLITAHGMSYKLEVVQLWEDDGKRFAGSNRSGSYLDMIPEAADGEEKAAVEEAAVEDQTSEVAAAEVTAPKATGKAAALAML